MIRRGILSDSFNPGALDGESTNSAEILRMTRFLKKAIREELTEKQRTCITMFLIEGKRQNEIAETLGVNSSTVCRHISAAKRKLVHTIKYYTRA